MTNASRRVYRLYDVSKATSYEQMRQIDEEFGDQIDTIDEHRNSMGYLLGFDILLKDKPKQQPE